MTPSSAAPSARDSACDRWRGGCSNHPITSWSGSCSPCQGRNCPRLPPTRAHVTQTRSGEFATFRDCFLHECPLSHLQSARTRRATGPRSGWTTELCVMRGVRTRPLRPATRVAVGRRELPARLRPRPHLLRGARGALLSERRPRHTKGDRGRFPGATHRELRVQRVPSETWIAALLRPPARRSRSTSWHTEARRWIQHPAAH